MDILPQLRTDIQLLPGHYQGRQVMTVRDSAGLREGIAVLNPHFLQLLQLFDGAHTIRDLQLAMMRLGGNRLVMESEARGVLNELDRLLLLKTERYQALLREAKAGYAALPARPPSLAGSAYPAEPQAVRDMLSHILTSAGSVDSGDSGHLRALVAPHIDLRTGAQIYGKAYGCLRGRVPRRIVILGTGHAMEEGLFSLTDKHYDTPLGAFPVDLDAVRSLRVSGSSAVAPDDFAHRSEHSIEFQVLILRFLLPEPIPVVPILCGSVTEWLGRVEAPAAIPGVGLFLDALRRIIDEDTLVVAGIDLSHVGPKFGDADSAHIMESEFRTHDERMLDALCRGSAADLWSEASRVGDRYHVCGLPVLTWLLELLPGARGTVVGYQVWHESPTRSAVSFAGVALE